MKRSSKIAVGIVTSLTLGLGTAVYANQGGMGAGAHGKGGMQHEMKGGMGHAMQGAGHGAQGHGAQGHGTQGHSAANPIMTPEERTALREKMRNATPEERRKIADATRAQMQARAPEKGMTGHGHQGPRTGAASGSANPAQASTTTEHVH